LDSIDDITERQLVVHFEVMPSVSDEADLLCGDVRVLDNLVLTTEDGSSGFNDDVSATGNVNLTLPVNITELLNGTLEVVPQQMTCSSTPIISPEEAAQIQRGKIKIAPLKRPPRKLVSETSNTQHQNQHTIETNPKRMPYLDDVSLMFEQWLASVTERINQTMHFGMPGNPDPLVYQIPHSFFECLRERISANGRKKRLPNNTVVFQRKDRPPFSTLTKYTWHLNNPMHVKHIFDTPQVILHYSFYLFCI
jgi:hypothetical protein